VASSPQLRRWQHKCVVIPYGIDMTSGDAPERVAVRADAIRREAGGQPLVLFVGRLVKYKGVDVLLAAMRGVAARMVLVGDGPEKAALQRVAERAGRGRPREISLGRWRPDELAALYRACDLFVLPSVTRQEAFGRGADRSDGLRQAGDQHGPGHRQRLGEPGRRDRDSWCRRGTLPRFTTQSSVCWATPNSGRLMGAAARHRARTVFGADRMVASVLGLFREVVGSGRAAA
jgi:hypothetical protein